MKLLCLVAVLAPPTDLPTIDAPGPDAVTEEADIEAKDVESSEINEHQTGSEEARTGEKADPVTSNEDSTALPTSTDSEVPVDERGDPIFRYSDADPE